jgi:hypothetical protein
LYLIAASAAGGGVLNGYRRHYATAPASQSQASMLWPQKKQTSWAFSPHSSHVL